MDNIIVNNILISRKEPYGTKNSLKYFIGYNDNDIIRPLCLKLPRVTGYFRKFNENSTISFRVKDKQLLKNCNRIWGKTESLMRIDFESKPVYGDDDKYIKTKIKIYAKSMMFRHFCFLISFGISIYLLLAPLIFLYHLYSNLLLHFLIFLCFFDNRLNYYSHTILYITKKKFYHVK